MRIEEARKQAEEDSMSRLPATPQTTEEKVKKAIHRETKNSETKERRDNLKKKWLEISQDKAKLLQIIIRFSGII